VIVMDRENAMARGWSHVLSTTNDLTELERFRIKVGAPRQALQAGKDAPEDPLYDAAEMDGIVSADPRKPYDVREIIGRLIDASLLQ